MIGVIGIYGKMIIVYLLYLIFEVVGFLIGLLSSVMWFDGESILVGD